MKKKLTIAIIVGFSSLILGLILVGIGFFTGGVERLTEISQPEKITKSYTNLSDIRINFVPQEILVQESSDEQFHITYMKSKNNLHNALQIKQEGENVTLTSARNKFRIQGILQTFGEILSQEYDTSNILTIKIPKDKTLDKLTIETFSYISILNSTIDEVDLSGEVHLENVQLNSGQINGNLVTIDQSTLKNLTIYSTNSSVHLTKSQLENVSLKEYFELDASALTLKGENTFTPTEERLTVTNIDLTNQSLKDLSWNIHNSVDKKSFASEDSFYELSESELEELYEGGSYLEEQLQNVGIFTKDKYEKLPVSSTKDEYSLIVDKKESKNKLTIKTTNATINIRTPE